MLDDMEPQNKLTAQFTEAEWKALKQLRAALSDIFADAFPYKPNAREASIDIWGITVNPQNASKDARVSVVLMKFLRAKDLSFPDAWDMLKQTLRWRDRFDIDAAMKEEFSPKVFGQVPYVHGRDKEGRPVVYQLHTKKVNKTAMLVDKHKYLRSRVATAEKCARLLDFNEVDQFVNVVDLSNFSYEKTPQGLKHLEGTNKFLQDHYPRLAHQSILVNLSFMLRWGMEMGKQNGTISLKATLVGTGKRTIKKALLPFIDSKELPKKYGGESDGF